jgi:type II secretory pathway pseudopilin PulG
LAAVQAIGTSVALSPLMTYASAPRDDQAERGFSLVEVLVVASLLIVVIAGVAQVFVIASRATAAAQHATYATVLAAQKMEELRATQLDAVAESVDYADPRGSVVVEGAGSPRATYERRWSVEPLADAPGLFVITVTVAHHHARPPASRARLITLRSVRRPPSEVEEATPDE